MASLLLLLLLSLSLSSLFLLVSSQPSTDPAEVAALKAIWEEWGLGGWSTAMDPCKDPNASWSPDSANPRIACDCSVTCRVTHLKVYALDVSGAIPEAALFKLTELMDL